MSDDGSLYHVLMAMGSLDPLKVRIILITAHLSPTQLTGLQLTQLLGYSAKARTIYRGVLDELEKDGYLVIDRPTPKRFSIRANPHHPIMADVIDLAIKHGDSYTTALDELLQEIGGE